MSRLTVDDARSTGNAHGMNKAFVREPEPTDALRCPRCGTLGKLVPAITLDTQLRAEARQKLGSTGYYCSFPTCEVVYFDAFDRFAELADCERVPYPKDPHAPICGCHGFSTEAIEADLAVGSVERTRAAVAQAKANQSECPARSPWGESCIGEIQRYYMRRQAELKRGR
ncbi:MAG: hypothetical protein JNM18_21915 [Planctomycetaceae bacterium]|nr:hypothetical protein [Planctomycetaceae bacterium]